MITTGNTFYGVSSVFGGIVCIIGAILVYKNYQKKSLKDRYGR